nr:nitrous oxide reductase maturation periplasmic protein [uncultured bacterium]
MSASTRRRFLAISAAAVATPICAAAAETRVHHWRGAALGAAASITLNGTDAATAARIVDAGVAEIARLERIFSLHRDDSALARLNRDGRLDAPPFELLELLGICADVHDRTGGAFDPTVQPLWALHAERHAAGAPPSPAEIEQVLERTGWRHLRFDSASVSFDRAGMALTLNGIAQGYIADRVAMRLRDAGLRDVLVDMGEIAAFGARPGGGPWRVGIAGGARRDLSDAAIATSAPLGTTLDAAGTAGHILDPRTGHPGGRWRQVTVIARSAALADGFSTGFCLMPEARIEAVAGLLDVLLVA